MLKRKCWAHHDGKKLLPSVVRYMPDETVVVGEQARAAASDDAQNTIVSVKRFVGRAQADIEHHGNLPYQFTNDAGMLRIKTRAGEKSPVEVAAESLKT